MSTMPNLIGMDFLSATATLSQTGLMAGIPVQVRIESGPSSTTGTVIGQSIAAGATVAAGTFITLTVNKPAGQFPASEQNEPIPYWYFLQSATVTSGGVSPPPPPPPVTLDSLVFGNLAAGGAAQFSYENMAIFKNRVHEARGFTSFNSPWETPVSVDANGWPTITHTVLLWEGGAGNLPGWASAATASTPFKCGYIGTGTVTAFVSGTIANFVAGNGTTTYSTFDFYGVTNNFGWQNTAGATNIFAYLPGYPAEAIDYSGSVVPQSAYTNEILTLWSNFAGIRPMWPSNVTGNTALNTSSTRRTAANTKTNMGWASANTEGYPQAWFMYLAKYAGIGYWCNLPAYDDGTNNSAGSYTSATLTDILNIIVPSGRQVFLELDNEIWGGYASGLSGPLGSNAVAHGFASSMSDFTGILKYFAYLHHELANMCRSIFGSSFGLGKQVQLIMCYQMGGNGYSTAFPTVLNYLNTTYGTPSNDIHGLGHAPYMNLSNNAGDTTQALVLSDLTAQALSTPYGFGCEHTSILAAHWGLPMYMYEGQWQLNVEAANANIPAVITSTSLTPILESWGKTTLDAGFQNINWFEVGVAASLGTSPYTDELGATWPPSNANSPQLTAIEFLGLNTYVPQRNVIAASGNSIAAGNFADLQNGTPYSLETNDTLLPSFTYSVAPAQFYCPSAQTRTLVLTIAGSGTVGIELNGVMVFTGVSVVNGANTIGSVSLKKGFNYIAIGCNSFQIITSVGPVVFN